MAPAQLFLNIETLTVGLFKFRAECEADAIALAAAIPTGELHHLLLKRIAPLPDTEGVILTPRTLEGVRELCRSVTNGHCMLQTIQPLVSYTGIRNLNLK